jgi:hypothetical protein
MLRAVGLAITVAVAVSVSVAIRTTTTTVAANKQTLYVRETNRVAAG